MTNGYVVINLNDTEKIYSKALKVLASGKPVLVMDDPQVYYADTITMSGDDVVITKGGKTITITDANAVSSIGNIQKHLWYHGLNIYKGTESSVQAVILNNSDTLINSVNKLKQWAEAIDGKVVININGAITISGTIYSTIAIVKKVDNKYQIFYQGASAVEFIDNINLSDYFTTCDDAVNQLL